MLKKRTRHLWDELECPLGAGTSRPTSMPDLTNAILTERAQIPTDTFQNVAESLPRIALM